MAIFPFLHVHHMELGVLGPIGNLFSKASDSLPSSDLL